MKTIIKWANGILKRIAEDHVGAYASQSAYFIILSALPFCIFLLTLLRYSPIDYQEMMHIINVMMPDVVSEACQKMFTDIYNRSTIALMSITVLFVLWSAGRGILSIMRGINEIYHIHETRNYIHLRLIATLYTFVLAVGLLFTLALLVFGNIIYQKIVEWFPVLGEFAAFVISIRMVIILVFLSILFIFIYKVLPNKKTLVFHVIPGAVAVAFGWMITSIIFSIWFSYSRNFAYMYGSLAGIMMLMLWLYTCMYEVFLGAELNNLLHPKEISGDTLDNILNNN